MAHKDSDERLPTLHGWRRDSGKDSVVRIQLLPEDLVITAEMPEQDWWLLLPVLPALAADDRRETARQDLDAVNIMVQCISEICPELSALTVKIGLDVPIDVRHNRLVYQKA